MPGAELPIAVIGFGAIGKRFVELVRDGQAGATRVEGILIRDHRRRGGLTGIEVCDDLDVLLGLRPGLVLEAAGHDAVRAHAARVLGTGTDLVLLSIGALADEPLHAELTAAAARTGARILLASGAVGALDALSAARPLGLREVTHTIRKPPEALGMEVAPTEVAQAVVFEGTARQAALSFPANANVVAAIGFVGIGLDRTTVRVVADPSATRNTHEIHAAGTFGELEFRIANEPSPDNPRSSLLAAGSLAAALARRTDLLALA